MNEPKGGQLMADQHPLTDEICDQIQDSVHPCDPENMRTAADWQLEQITEWLRKNLPQTLYLEPIGYIEYKKEDRLSLIDDLKKAMRPQEDNCD